MTREECFRRQIEATLKIEKEYAKEPEELLKVSNIKEDLKQVSLDAIARNERLRSLYI
ncbi:MAG: hypothetical protein MJA82_10915 [Clostridia bacterium]|nr:hypothetical protein [Clostridia bacterium]